MMEPLGGRPEFLLISFVQYVCEAFRRAPFTSRARGHGGTEVMGDPEARDHSSVVEISIFPGAHASKASKLRVQGGAETKAGTVYRIPFG
jgi:hypothetical protein